MKTTLIAITLGLTIRIWVCGSIKPAENRDQVARATSSAVIAMHHYKVLSRE